MVVLGSKMLCESLHVVLASAIDLSLSLKVFVDRAWEDLVREVLNAKTQHVPFMLWLSPLQR